MFEYYKERFPISQHPNFVCAHYPTRFYLEKEVSNVGLVCEVLDDDVTTLRGTAR